LTRTRDPATHAHHTAPTTALDTRQAFRREVLFAFEPATGAAAAASPAATKALAQSSTAFEEAGRAGRSPTLVLINVSPIDYGHVLLCPRVLDCLPQNLDAATVRTALHFALEVGNPYLRVGFNSLGAFATINHLHFQAYYLAAPLPCERAPTRALPLRRGAQHAQHSGASAATTARAAEHDSHPVAISLLADYPVRGWVVEGPSLAGMAQVVGDASLALQAANIPHNVLIADCGARVFIWPQAYAERQARGLVPEELLDVGVNPAVWEISGHLVLKRARDYAEFTEGAAWALLAAVSLTEADIARLSEQLWGGSGEAVGTGLAMGSVPADSGGAGAAAAGGGSGGGDPMVGVVPAAGATRPPQPQHLLAAAAACCN
jgi:GDP-L-galactose phosphorylase